MINNKISFIIIAISTIIAEMFIWRENNMSKNTIAIVVALIGVIGSIWSQIIQFRKDAQRIDDVNKTSASVKQDTIKMEPSVTRIENNTDAMKERMLEDILPQLKAFEGKMNRFEGGLDILVKNAEFEEKIRGKVTNTATDPTFIKGAVDVIYEENARLNNQVVTLTNQNILLKSENRRLENENEMLRNMVKEQDYEMEEYDIYDSEPER